MTIAGVAVSVRAPGAVLSVLARMLAGVASTPHGTAAVVRIAVDCTGERWRIARANGDVETLHWRTPLPQVGGAVIASMVADVAAFAHLTAWRCAVVVRDDRAVAFVGDDWESCIVLAAHLHVRGWRFLGADRVLFDRHSLTIFAVRKSLYVSLSFVDDLPLAYRRSVEGSPWYSTPPHDIAFYAVDPALAHPGQPWSESGRLRAVFRIDGTIADAPAIVDADAFALGCGVSSADLRAAGVAVAELTLGEYRETCNIVESWLSAALPAVG